MNSNNSFEILFFKVFHNKYLFNKIITFIESNRIDKIKFQKIYKLSFIAKEGLYSLLYSKLKSTEYIHLDSSSIFKLFGDCSSDSSVSSICSNEELIKLFIEKQGDSANRVSDLVEDSILSNNVIALINILEKYSYKSIFPKIILESLKKSNQSTLEFILDPYNYLVSNKIIVNEDLISKSVSYIVNNNKLINKNNIIVLFLNHPAVLEFINDNSNNKSHNQNLINRPIKKIKSIKYNSFSNKSSGAIKTIEFKKIKFEEFLALNDIELQYILLNKICVDSVNLERFSALIDIYESDDSSGSGNSIVGKGGFITVKQLKLYLDLFFRLCFIYNKDASGANIEDYFELSNDTKDEISSILNGSNSSDSNSSNSNDIIKKQLKRVLVRESKSDKLYIQYLLQYDEPIEDLNNHLLLEYAFRVFSINGLKYLLEKKMQLKEQENQMVDGFNEELNNLSLVKIEGLINHSLANEIVLKNQGRIPEFLTLYYSQFKYNSNSNNSTSSNNINNYNNDIITTNKVILKPSLWTLLDVKTLSQIFSIKGILKQNYILYSNQIRLEFPFSTLKWYIENILKKVTLSSSNNNNHIYHHIKDFPIHFKEKSEIDYFLNNKSIFILDFSMISCESLELLDYFRKSLPQVPKSIIFANKFIESIYNCDLETLKYIDRTSKVSFMDDGRDHSFISKSTSNLSLSQILERVCQLFKYLNESNFKNFSPLLKSKVLYSILSILSSVGYNREGKLENEKNLHQRKELFKNIILSIKFIQIGDIIKIIVILFSFICQNYGKLTISLLELFLYHPTLVNHNSGISISEEVIKNETDFFDNSDYKDYASTFISHGSVSVQVFFDLANLLFKSIDKKYHSTTFLNLFKCIYNQMFINCLNSKDYNISSIIKLNQLYQQYSISYNCNSFETVLFLLHSKSTKLSTFFLGIFFGLMKIPFNKDSCFNLELFNFVSNHSKLVEVFTIKFIENSSIEQLFEKLIMERFSLLPTVPLPSIISYKLLIKINEINYLLKLLEQQQQQQKQQQQQQLKQQKIPKTYFIKISDNVEQLDRLLKLNYQPLDLNQILEYSISLDNFTFVQFILNNFDSLKRIDYSLLFKQDNLGIIKFIYENHRYIIIDPKDSNSFFNFTKTHSSCLMDYEKHQLLLKYYPQFISSSFFLTEEPFKGPIKHLLLPINIYKLLISHSDSFVYQKEKFCKFLIDRNSEDKSFIQEILYN